MASPSGGAIFVMRKWASSRLTHYRSNHRHRHTNSPAINKLPKISLLFCASQSGRKMSKFAARSVVNRAARSVSGQRPRFSASTMHSATIRALSQAAKRNRRRIAATGMARIAVAMIAQIAVWASLISVKVCSARIASLPIDCSFHGPASYVTWLLFTMDRQSLWHWRHPHSYL
jgi:hypothetical protein